MKNIVILLFFISIVLTSKGQQGLFSYNKKINGYWGESRTGYTDDYFSKTRKFNYLLGGQTNNLILYSTGDHPSNYIFKLTIFEAYELFDISKNKDMKKRVQNAYKKKEWFRYEGELEYYYNGSINNFINDFPYSPGATSGKGVLKKEKVIVYVLGFKNNPSQYYFEFKSDTNLGLHFVLN